MKLNWRILVVVVNRSHHEIVIADLLLFFRKKTRLQYKNLLPLTNTTKSKGTLS